MHGAFGRVSWVGLLLVIVGVWWLLGTMGIVAFEWKYMGPLAIIFGGLAMLMGRRRWYRHDHWEQRPPQNPPM